MIKVYGECNIESLLDSITLAFRDSLRISLKQLKRFTFTKS